MDELAEALAWTRSSCACATTPRATLGKTCPGRATPCASAIARAPSASAGTGARPRRARCAPAASWWAWAWPPPSTPHRATRAQATATLRADGTAVVRCATSDMGPGTYTAATQVAADALGLPIGRVRFELGDSTLPSAKEHGGSTTLASVGSAVRPLVRPCKQSSRS
ncbi:MAG: molybdopterin cofactor-binding domain-containing protein [Hymenobacter sp.]